MNHKPPTGGICPNLVTAVCSGLLLCLSPQVTTGAEEERIDVAVPEEGSELLPQTTTGTEDERPVVLVYRVSHHRNTDEVSLVFRQDAVQLVVNTDFWQEETMPRRLGVFEAGYNRELSRLKTRLEVYHDYHAKYVSMRSLIDIPGFRSTPDPIPHAPRIFIGGKEVPSEHGHHEVLFGIIRSVWDHQWSCVHCAFYRIRGDSIMRTMKFSSADGKEHESADEFFGASELEYHKKLVKIPPIDRPQFYRDEESLDCVRTGKYGTKMECLDSRFGLFELPMPALDTSSALDLDRNRIFNFTACAARGSSHHAARFDAMEG